jgi:uncharacterized protein (DUF58 family)
MNLSVVTLLATLLVAAVAYAAPELSVEQGTYNFGSVIQGKKVQHTFVIRNSGDAPLQIKQLSAACGCTAARPSSSLILPGRSAEVQVSFDSSDFSGKVEKTVVMASNSVRYPNYTFTLQGTVVDPLQASPRQLSLGPLTPGVAKQATVTITNRSGSTVKLLSVNVTSNSLQIKTSIKKGELKPGETGTVEVSVTPRPEARIMSGYLHIVTNDPQKEEIAVPVYGLAAK